MLPLVLVMGTLNLIVILLTQRFLKTWFRRISVYVFYLGILGLIASEACYRDSKFIDFFGWNNYMAFDYSFMGIFLAMPAGLALIIWEVYNRTRQGIRQFRQQGKELLQKLNWKNIRGSGEQLILSNKVNNKNIYLKIVSMRLLPNEVIMPSNQLPKKFKLIIRGKNSKQRPADATPKLKIQHHDFDNTFDLLTKESVEKVRSLLSVAACEKLVELAKGRHKNLDLCILIEKQKSTIYIPSKFFFDNIDIIKQYTIVAAEIMDILENYQSIQTYGKSTT